MKSRSIIPNPFTLASVAGLALAALLAGCTTTPRQSPLRVGITPDYPPLVFEQGDGLAGAEIDLAGLLGAQLGRPVQFVPMRWEQLIPALQEQRIDIIMSGMSVTRPRQLRIAFSEPYLHNRLRAIFTRRNAGRFKTRQIPKQRRKNWRGARHVRRHVCAGKLPEGGARQHRYAQDAAFYLLQDRRTDVFVDDSFALAQILSENEASLTYLAQPLAGDDLAWGVRPEDQELLRKVNLTLAQWKSDGTLDRILLRWIPYLKKYESLLQGEPTGEKAR